MGDTPRTDRIEDYEMEEHARQLERELAAYEQAARELPSEPELQSMSRDGFKTLQNMVDEADYNKLRAYAIALKVELQTEIKRANSNAGAELLQRR